MMSMDEWKAALQEVLQPALSSIHEKLDSLANRLDAVEQRLDAVEQRLDAVEQRLDAVEQRLDAVDQRFEQIDRHLENVDAKISTLDETVRRLERDGREIKPVLFSTQDMVVQLIDTKFPAMMDELRMTREYFVLKYGELDQQYFALRRTLERLSSRLDPHASSSTGTAGRSTV